MKPVIAANWKMNLTQTEANTLVKAINKAPLGPENIELIIAPPAPYLNQVVQTLEKGQVAAQTVSEHASGAYTGEVSAKMVQSCGASMALLGHSERRHLFYETNDMIRSQLKQCRQWQLTPILCVGETIEERNAGNFKSIIGAQLDVILDYEDMFYIAYEPVWAIGTGKTASSEQAQEVHQFIRGVLSDLHGDEIARQVRIQYGGSVKPGNARELMSQPDIDGALVGGASLDAKNFSEIILNSI